MMEQRSVQSFAQPLWLACNSCYVSIYSPSPTGLRPDDYRTNFVAFTIKAGLAGDYRLAVRAKSAAQPEAQGIRDSKATIVRTLDATPINVYLPFQMDTDLFDAETAWTDATSGDFSLTHDMVDAAQLQADTDYVLYAVSESDSTVHWLLDFRTDAEPGATIVSNSGFFYNVLPDHTFTLKQSEPFLYVLGIVNILAPVGWEDSNYQTAGVDDSQTTVMPSGVAIPPVSANDASLYFTGKITQVGGRFAMASKVHHEHTTLNSGDAFTISMLQTSKYSSKYSTNFVIQ